MKYISIITLCFFCFSCSQKCQSLDEKEIRFQDSNEVDHSLEFYTRMERFLRRDELLLDRWDSKIGWFKNLALPHDLGLELKTYLKKDPVIIGPKDETISLLNLYIKSVCGLYSGGTVNKNLMVKANIKRLLSGVEKQVSALKKNKTEIEFINAIGSGNLGKVKELLDKGISPNLLTKEEKFCDVVDTESKHVALLAIEKEKWAVFAELVSRYDSTEEHTKKIFWELLRLNKQKYLNFFLRRYPEFSFEDKETGSFPVHYVTENGNVDTLKFLDQYKKIHNLPNKFGWTPMMIAKSLDSSEKEAFFKTRGFKISPTENRRVKALRVLKGKESVPKGFNFDLVLDDFDNNGVSFLCSVVVSRNLSLFSDLVKGDYQIDWDISNKKGYSVTPLTYVCLKGLNKFATLLLETELDVNKPIRTGETPISMAVQGDHFEIVEKLLEKGADINQADDMGIYPLFVAVGNQSIEMVKLLLANGANPKIEICNGGTAISLAQNQGQTEIAELLESKP